MQSSYWSLFLIATIAVIQFDLVFSKPPKGTEDNRLPGLDYVRPDHSPFQTFRLKNAVDALAPGKKGERKGSLHDVEIVTPPALKKTKKAKETLLKASSLPHVGYLDSNLMMDVARKDMSVAKLGAAPGGAFKAKKPETEAQRAERINKQFEKMMQFTSLLGHVDSFLYDRAKSVVKTLHRMMGDSREMIDVPDFETNDLRRRRHSHPDFTRTVPIETRTAHEESNSYEPKYVHPMESRVITNEESAIFDPRFAHHVSEMDIGE